MDGEFFVKFITMHVFSFLKKFMKVRLQKNYTLGGQECKGRYFYGNHLIDFL